MRDVRCWGDSVAKVVLPKALKILRAAGAVFVYLSRVMNIVGIKPLIAAIAA
jgi:hypothetical protein